MSVVSLSVSVVIDSDDDSKTSCAIRYHSVCMVSDSEDDSKTSCV